LGKPSKDRDNVDYVPTVFNDEKKRIVVSSNPERADRAAKRRKHVDVDQNHTMQRLKLPFPLHLIMVIKISLQLYFINL